MPKASPKSTSALVVLSDPQIGSNFQFDRAAASAAVTREVALIKQEQGSTALRAIRLGLYLYCVKECGGHGKFMPFVKKSFGASHKTATDYMRLARYYVEKSRSGAADVLRLADARDEVALTDDRFAKTRKFIGDKTLTELIAEAREALASEPTKKPKGGGEDDDAPDAEQLYLFARDEISGAIQHTENLFLKENKLQYLVGHPEELRGAVAGLRDVADKVEAAADKLLKK